MSGIVVLCTFFLGPFSVVYRKTSTNHQSTTMDIQTKSSRRFGYLGNFYCIRFFPLIFLLRAMGIGHGLGIRTVAWNMDEKVVFCFSSVFILLSYLRLDNYFFLSVSSAHSLFSIFSPFLFRARGVI